MSHVLAVLKRTAILAGILYLKQSLQAPGLVAEVDAKKNDDTTNDNHQQRQSNSHSIHNQPVIRQGNNLCAPSLRQDETIILC